MDPSSRASFCSQQPATHLCRKSGRVLDDCITCQTLADSRPDASALSPHQPAGEEEEKTASLWLCPPAGWKEAKSLATIRCCGSPMGTQTDRRRYGGGKLAAAGKDEKITAANFLINKPAEDFTEIYPQRCFRGSRGLADNPPPSTPPLPTVLSEHPGCCLVLQCWNLTPSTWFSCLFFCGKWWKTNGFSNHSPDSWKNPLRMLLSVSNFLMETIELLSSNRCYCPVFFSLPFGKSKADVAECHQKLLVLEKTTLWKTFSLFFYLSLRLFSQRIGSL